MIKKTYFCILLLSFLIIGCASGQTINRNIPITITPYANCDIYMGSYFGKGRIMADTAWLNEKGQGVFKGKRKLTSGLYFVISPKSKILFEFILDSAQNFSISADTTRLNDVKFAGSAENTGFRQYIQGILPQGAVINSLAHQLQSVKTKADSIAIQNKLQVAAHDLRTYKNAFYRNNPKLFVTLMLRISEPPPLPDGFALKTHIDTLKAGYYIKNNYWTDVPFNDDRLLYTPFFEPRIDDYFKYSVSGAADSVIKEVQYMLLYARTGKEIYPYLLTKFVNEYLNPIHAGQSKVFLYLFNDFLMRGDTALFDARSKKLLYERAYAMMANQVGDAAPPLNLTNIADGQNISLYSIKSPYTLVVFWDPGCIHCQKQLPRIDSIYRVKWKALGIKLFSVNIDAQLVKDVGAFAKAKNLSGDWIHTYQTNTDAQQMVKKGQLSYLQLYGVGETPSLYLLDADKHIIAKYLSIEQFDALIAVKNRNGK